MRKCENIRLARNFRGLLGCKRNWKHNKIWASDEAKTKLQSILALLYQPRTSPFPTSSLCWTTRSFLHQLEPHNTTLITNRLLLPPPTQAWRAPYQRLTLLFFPNIGEFVIRHMDTQSNTSFKLVHRPLVAHMFTNLKLYFIRLWLFKIIQDESFHLQIRFHDDSLKQEVVVT